MSKDILAPFEFDWAIMGPVPMGLADVDANDWAEGGLLVVPSLLMEDREAFPMNEAVGIQVGITIIFTYIFIFVF